jgi:hypothetical protein
VSKYIKSCISCVIAKPTTKKQGIYTPLPTPDRSWESISMDYMSGLPSTKRGNDCVFVVVDRFSKMAILAACKKSITIEATTKLFFERVWVHFGIPQTIVSDRDNWFLEHILVEPLVTAGHQAHQIHDLPPPDRWPNRGHKSNDRAYHVHVQFQAPSHMG